MNIVICGAGQVGFPIARQLAEEHNDITIVDTNPQLIQRVNDTLDAQGMIGFASHPDVLERAGVEDADMLIAVTYADEVNMVACQVAHSLFNVPTKIARVRAQSYLNPIWRDLFSRDHMPIDVIISPEIEVAEAVVRRLHVPGAFDTIPFAEGAVQVIGVFVGEDCPVSDTPMRQLTELFPDLNIVVVAIVRGDRMVVPTGDDQMRAGDEIYFVADSNHVARAMALFGHEEQEARRMIIVGGGNIGLYIAGLIEGEDSGVRVNLIERNPERARLVADRLEHAVVINGDALDREILSEANVESTETVVAVTDDDQVNILVSLLAKRQGTERVVTLINNASYGPLISSLGIDVAVNPRATTVSSILRHVRRGRIRGVYSLRDGMAEIIDAEAMETSPLVGQPLREARVPSGVIVGAVVREGTIVIPRGDTVIKTGDRVIMFALADRVRQVEKMFSVRIDFF